MRERYDFLEQNIVTNQIFHDFYLCLNRLRSFNIKLNVSQGSYKEKNKLKIKRGNF